MTTITKLSVDLATAERAIEAATAKARAMGLNMSIAVVDEAGDLCAFRRMEGAPRLTIDIAINKAYTSASFGLPTHAWWNDNQDEIGAFLHGYDSLWLPATLLQAGQRKHLSEALFAASRHMLVRLHFNKGLAGAKAILGDKNTPSTVSGVKKALSDIDTFLDEAKTKKNWKSRNRKKTNPKTGSSPFVSRTKAAPAVSTA